MWTFKDITIYSKGLLCYYRGGEVKQSWHNAVSKELHQKVQDFGLLRSRARRGSGWISKALCSSSLSFLDKEAKNAFHLLL